MARSATVTESPKVKVQDPELKAMLVVDKHLAALTEAQADRVLAWVWSRHDERHPQRYETLTDPFVPHEAIERCCKDEEHQK